GVFATEIFWPSRPTSQTGPIFSVTSILPSGRKARRQGSSKVATVVMLKGPLASGFCSPALTWPHTAAEARGGNHSDFATFIIIFFPRFLSARNFTDPGALL